MTELLALTIGLVMSASIMIFVLFMLIGDFMGAPFVPSPGDELDQLLEKWKPGKRKVFLDMGSGEGIMVRKVARKYDVKATGIEINPWPVLYSNAAAKITGVKNAKFKAADFWKADISDVDYIYIYLLPRTVKKLAVKIKKEGKKGLTVVSKAFELKDWKSNLTDTWIINNRSYYVYRT